jgi:uncharacterized protein
MQGDTPLDIIPASSFRTLPWKNGGGITHEIARADDGAALLWRLSIAEVASDGPFSAFPGLNRILTVIRGAGLVLHGPEGPLAARPLVPVAFSGDVPIDGRMVDGPIHDLNLIYDANRVRGQVSVLTGPLSQTLPPQAGTDAVLCLAGPVQAAGQTVPQGAMALGPCDAVELGPDAQAVLVRLSPR